MNASVNSFPASNPASSDIPTSWEKTLEALEYLNTVIEPEVMVEFAIKRIAPGLPSRNVENVTVARKMGVARNTVDNWRNSTTSCSMPLALAIAVGKTLDGPDHLLEEVSRFTGEDHTQFFQWAS